MFRASRLLLLILLSLPLTAQAGDSEKLQAMVDELRALTDKARNQRAADRWLINSMDDLAARYDWPWRRKLLMEDFSDGNFNRNPAWQVVSGQFWVDRRLGLRSQVTASSTSQQTEKEKKKKLKDALAEAALDALLGPAPNNQNGNSGSGTSYREAEIHLPLRIPATFALETSFSFHNAPGEQGEMGLALMQDQRGAHGYQLNLLSGNKTSVELTLRRGGRTSIIERMDLNSFDARQSHTLEWRHDAYGQIEVSLDGKRLFRIRDRSFRNDFSRLGITNYSGDVAIQGVTVYGR
jgi:hypothetical protein